MAKPRGEMPRDPHPLTGGSGRTSKNGKHLKRRHNSKWRDLPKIRLSSVEQGYATLLAQGWDTVAETFDLIWTDEMAETLEAARQVAADLDHVGGAPHTILFGGEEIQISPRKSKPKKKGGGTGWFLQNDDFQIEFRPVGMPWPVTIRYFAAGLWEHGLEALRKRAIGMLVREFKPVGDDWWRISRADWAFDFYSPAFTKEHKFALADNIVAHSSCKRRARGKVEIGTVGRARCETTTVGSKKTLQLEVYDKGLEIVEKSGKEWMVYLWRREGYCPPPGEELKHVWRVEVRMGKEFLRNRYCERFEDVEELLPNFLAEAIFKRRICGETSDTNRRRRPLHPLLTVAYLATPQATVMAPIGRWITSSPEEREASMLRTMAGCDRSMGVIQETKYIPDAKLGLEFRIREVQHNDPDHDAKVERLREKEKYGAEAK